MKKIKLSKKDEEKWLELIKKNKREFIFKLYEHLEYKEAIDLVISNNLITELLLDKIEVRDKNNEYITYKYKFIDDAYLAHAPRVRIIHGRGTYALRDAVHKLLKKSTIVKEFNYADAYEGGDGATIVTFN